MSPTDARRARPADGQGGYVAGLESLAFGFLVFVVGTLVVANAWTVVDAKFAVEGAAREAARAVVEAAPAGGAVAGSAGHHRGIAAATARSALAGMRPGSAGDAALDLADAPVVEGSLDRGECVRVTVAVEVPLVRVPLVGAAGGTRRVVGRHRERVDPYRAGLAVGDDVVGATC